MNEDQHDAVIGRLEREREQAERRYVAALAALDTASQPPDALVSSAAAIEAELLRLNTIWGQARAGAGAGSRQGFVSRVMAEIGRLMPWRRRALHGAMLATINRQAEVIRALIDATRHFNSHVIWYGQTVAPFAASQRRGTSSAQGVEVVHAAVNALASDWRLHWDALQAREQRYEARSAALTKAYDELREVASLAQQSTASLKRTVEALSTASSARPAVAPITNVSSPSATATPDLNAFAYVAFEDRYRGSTDEIRKRLQDYLPVFAGAANVLDVGCGRGELLDLLREQGVEARGIDINDEMVAICRDRGLKAEKADAIAFLNAQPEHSLGGLIAIQVVEHLEPSYLIRFIEAAHRAMKTDAPLVLETINAACWSAFFDSYIRDFTHVRPLHPDTMRYLVQAGGFRSVEIQFRSPFGREDRLPTVPLPAAEPPGDMPAAGPSMADLIEALNAHAERLNSRLFTHRDYAIVARR
jgi:2-polyprenyl-3-methyl-5-hydroxy-6-metoxy-1,4-benzoquinol methylase